MHGMTHFILQDHLPIAIQFDGDCVVISKGTSVISSNRLTAFGVTFDVGTLKDSLKGDEFKK